MFELSDIFIGDYPETQAFGARPEVYAARYNLKGHNGLDFGCPSLTPVLGTAAGWISETGFDTGGYGNYIKIVHNGFLTLYGHLNDIQVKKGDRVIAGQLIGHSNNTGFSDAPHLHFGVAPCDANGIKTDPQNGFSGYIDPNGSLCHWNISNPTQPAVPGAATEEKPDIPVKFDEFGPMVAQGSNYKVIAAYGISHGLNEYLQSINVQTIDLTNNPADPEGGQKVVQWIAGLLQVVNQVPPPPANPVYVNPPVGSGLPPEIAGLPDSQKQGLLTGIFDALKSLFFTKKQ